MKHSVAVVLIKGSEVLLQLRDQSPKVAAPGFWAIPGGETMSEESFKEAAQREFQEETGYFLKKPIFFKRRIYSWGGEKIECSFFYEVYDNQQEIKCFEGQKMAFVSAKDFWKMKIFPSHIQLAKTAIKLANNHLVK